MKYRNQDSSIEDELRLVNDRDSYLNQRGRIAKMTFYSLAMGLARLTFGLLLGIVAIFFIATVFGGARNLVKCGCWDYCRPNGAPVLCL